MEKGDWPFLTLWSVFVCVCAIVCELNRERGTITTVHSRIAVSFTVRWTIGSTEYRTQWWLSNGVSCSDLVGCSLCNWFDTAVFKFHAVGPAVTISYADNIAVSNICVAPDWSTSHTDTYACTDRSTDTSPISCANKPRYV
jgi:hypothetical protein